MLFTQPASSPDESINIFPSVCDMCVFAITSGDVRDYNNDNATNHQDDNTDFHKDNKHMHDFYYLLSKDFKELNMFCKYQKKNQVYLMNVFLGPMFGHDQREELLENVLGEKHIEDN